MLSKESIENQHRCHILLLVIITVSICKSLTLYHHSFEIDKTVLCAFFSNINYKSCFYFYFILCRLLKTIIITTLHWFIISVLIAYLRAEAIIVARINKLIEPRNWDGWHNIIHICHSLN